jgi:hypothetical protein
MKRTLQLVVLVVPPLAAAFFTWGVLVGQYKIFPFEVLRGLKWFQGSFATARPG